MSSFSSNKNLKTYDEKRELIVNILLALWAILQIYFNSFSKIDLMSLRAFHGMNLVFFSLILYPRKKGLESKASSRLDLVLALVGAGSFIYLIMNYSKIARSGGLLSQLDLFVGLIGLILIIEAGRRASGNLYILALIFLAYIYIGSFIKGPLGHSSFSLRRVISHFYWGSQGVFGIGLGVSASYIFTFTLFGAFLYHSGFASLIGDLASSLVGRSRGGPAKVAVLASMLLGMINGSAVANVATTGVFTIPMMTRIGYSKEFAGAVEASSSTGGQFTPPIMGAVAFVMAEFLGLPYKDILIAAILPAGLYYFSILMAVDLEAIKLDLKGLDQEDLPSFKETMKKKGHLLIPLIVLVTMMLLSYTPLMSAMVGILASVLASQLSGPDRMRLKDIFQALVDGSKAAIGVGVSCLLIGLIIGTVSLTGLGLSLGNFLLSHLAEGQLILAGFLVMILSIILGMGVPGVAAYVIVVSVAGPVLIKAGALPLAGHMFCLFYACLANITPPVAISSYVAAGISGGDEFKTSLIGVKLSLVGFILPFFFLTNPILLLGQVEGVGFLQVAMAFFTSIIGTMALVFSSQGYLYGKLKAGSRLALLLIGLLNIHPNKISDLIGLLAFGSIILYRRNKYGKES